MLEFLTDILGLDYISFGVSPELVFSFLSLFALCFTFSIVNFIQLLFVSVFKKGK